MSEIQFDEIIQVLSIEDKVRNKVLRIIAKSDNGKFYLELDLHSAVYSMLPGGKYRMVISNSLHLGDSDVANHFPEGAPESLADEFDFVMHGHLYKISEAKGSNTQVVVYISFGGLQFKLKGDLLKLYQFTNQKLFLLLRKV